MFMRDAFPLFADFVNKHVDPQYVLGQNSDSGPDKHVSFVEVFLHNMSSRLVSFAVKGNLGSLSHLI